MRPHPGFVKGRASTVGRGRVGVRADPTAYRAQIDLPGIAMKRERVEADSADEIKRRIEGVVETWFKWLEQEAAAD